MPVKRLCVHLEREGIANIPHRTLYDHLVRARNNCTYGKDVKIGRPYEVNTQYEKDKLQAALDELARVKENSLTKAEILECGECAAALFCEFLFQY